MRNILVTGGAGFIGSHLVETLLKAGYHVSVLDNLSTGHLGNLAYLMETFPGQLSFVQGNVEDKSTVQSLASGKEAIYHLASVVGVKRVLQEPLATVLEGLRGVDYVLEVAAREGIPTLVASTSEVYGRLQEVLPDVTGLSEDLHLLLGSPAKHRWVYAITKLAKEALAIAYHRERGAPFVVVRFFNTVGPRQSAAYGMVIPNMVKAALSGKSIPIYGDGEQRRSFLHVTDAVEAIYRLLLDSPQPPWGEIFNVGNPIEVSIRALAEKIKTLTGSPSPLQFIPYEEAYGQGFEDMRVRTPNITKISTWIGWTPKKSLDEILIETITYYKQTIPSHTV